MPLEFLFFGLTLLCVAICGIYPEARSTGAWLREGWLMPLAYVAGFALLLATFGWRPDYG